MKNTLLYKNKPVFGLDIGFNTVKVMQVDKKHKQKHVVIGYGVTDFDSGSMEEGIIVNPEALAASIQKLFDKQIIGNITTDRCAIAVPVARTFTRTMRLPNMDQKDLEEAVKLEAEQYIPMPLSDLYIDHAVISRGEKETELLVVAAPCKIVDSYLTLCDLLGLEAYAIETTISAGARLFQHAENSDAPTVLIDFGSISSDITIFDKTLIVSGTVPGGGDSFSKIIADTLKVSEQEAHIIKTKYGLGVSKKQKEIIAGVTPLLEQLLKEIRRMIRYYEERSETNSKISQIVTLGGGANMPGLSEYITSALRVPARMCDPWQDLQFNDLQPPNNVEKTMYITVAGLSFLNTEAKEQL